MGHTRGVSHPTIDEACSFLVVVLFLSIKITSGVDRYQVLGTSVLVCNKMKCLVSLRVSAALPRGARPTRQLPLALVLAGASMVSESELDLIRAAMPALQLATAYDTVHNDECVYSFATPFSAGGLYVSLSSFLGFGEGFVVREQERRGDQLYVHLQSTRLPKDEQPQNESAEQKDAALTAPTRLAIGVEGGFTVEEEKSEVVSEKSLVLLSTAPPGAISVNECIRVRVPLPCVELPERVKEAAQAVIEHSGGLHADKAAAVAWEAEQVKPSKYALELVQLPPHKKINPDPSTWVCEESGARENLWLNLSDGHIGSGRRWKRNGRTIHNHPRPLMCPRLAPSLGPLP